ncbi:DUF3558 domain-containing protein [Streptomyces sp. NPDC050560]|uniref:DUF3558 domain-containing protein n=1 Tax=Streptomyces sp. NPDC050560 TaxID=3365630 RepID=UPI00379D52A3
MQRKAYLPGAAVLLAVLLAGCTMGSGAESDATDAKAGAGGTPSPSAEPGKYQSLPEPCGSVSHDSLDTLLPGVKDIKDERQRDHVYDGTATVTYDTNRRVGCSWKMDGPAATHHLAVDFERVVSYDSSISDDTRAEQVFLSKEDSAGIAAPPDSADPSGTPGDSPSADAGGAGAQGSVESPGSTASPGTADPSSPGDAGAPPEGLDSRTLDGLGDAAYVDDSYTSPSSAGGHRTVTVVFRTSNVVVTVQYEEQPSLPADVPDSKEMQDNAQELAHKLAGTLGG